MKKEMLVAVVIGFLLGLVITYGIYRLRISSNRKTANPVTSPASSAAPNASDSLITIHSPEDGRVQKEKSTTVTGSTIPEVYVVLFVNNTEYIRQSDGDGNFSFEVSLEDGSNLLTVKVLTEDGKTVTKERTVVVTTLYDQPITEIETATPSAKPSPTPKATVKPTVQPKATPKASPTATPTTR
jgi:hypothetical protein